ncbi:MAG: iron ABC transporter permease, partial [Proteobacteria bacterium]|nr:iron ABC transporter permease [Pseudomonadota bacterium]
MDLVQENSRTKQLVSSNWFLSFLGILAYVTLPWYGLDYGLFDSMWDEILEAYAWHGMNFSLMPVLAFFLVLLPFNRILSKKSGHMIKISICILIIFSVLVIALVENISFGLGAGVQIILLCLIISNESSSLGFLRGDKFMAGAIMFITVLVALFIFYPLGKIFSEIFFNSEGEFVPFQLFNIITSFGVGRILWNTLLMAFSVGLSTTFFGLVFAIYSVRSTSKLRGLIKVFYILPIITPPFVVGLSLILIFGRSGSINDLLVYLFGAGGVFVPEGSQGFFERSSYIYGYAGIFLAQTLGLTPVSYMMLVGMVSAINPALEEASLTMRASRWQTFKNVTFPLIRPGIANSFLLGVISSAADFGNPLVLGGEYDVLSTEIYFAIAGAQLDFARAATLGSLLFGISLSVYYLQKQWIGKKSYVTVTGVQTAGNVIPLPDWLQRIMSGIVVMWIFIVGALYTSILIGGFVNNWGADYTFTLKHHIELWGKGFSSGGWPSFFNSLSYSLIAAPLTGITGILIAYVLTRKTFTGKGFVNFGTTLIFAVPGTVVGVAYILAFNAAPIEITGTALILVVTMIIRSMPVGIRGGISALTQIDKTLEEASLMQRAGSFQTIRHV